MFFPRHGSMNTAGVLLYALTCCKWLFTLFLACLFILCLSLLIDFAPAAMHESLLAGYCPVYCSITVPGFLYISIWAFNPDPGLSVLWVSSVLCSWAWNCLIVPDHINISWSLSWRLVPASWAMRHKHRPHPGSPPSKHFHMSERAFPIEFVLSSQFLYD